MTHPQNGVTIEYKYVTVSSCGYRYRPDGLRHAKSTGNSHRLERTETIHHWDGQNIVMEAAGGLVKSRYLRGIGLIAQQIDGDLFYYLHNAHGDVTGRIRDNGDLTPEYRYDAFGNEREQVATDPNPFRHCGEYTDLETITLYLRNRSYDPATGRFGQEDPIRSGLNWYAYCGNDPIKFIDPLGLASVNFVDYIRAQGGTVTSTGEGKVSVTVNNQTSYWTLNSGKMDDAKINERFGFDSFLTDKERDSGVEIGIRNNKLYRDIITAGKDYYDLDYKGYTIRLHMDEYTMAVNMATGDGGILSSNYDESHFLAAWLKNLYYEQYQKEFELSTAAISVELKAHADWWNSNIPFFREHARVANIGVAGHELARERWLWDNLGDYGTFGSRRSPMPPMPPM